MLNEWLQRTFVLSEQGCRDFVSGALAAALANVVLMIPIGILYMVTAGFVDYLTGASAALPDLGFYAVAIVAVLAVMFATQWIEYDRTYNVVYDESARKRIGLGEKLRQLPLSFFGRRDLADLTSAIMKDCADHERLFSHVMPQLFGAALSTLVVAVSLFAFDWRLACAALWPLPVAALGLFGTVRAQQRAGRARNAAGLALNDGIQEFLDCSREIRATNQVASFVDELGERVAALEGAKMRAELVAGVAVNLAQAFLRFGMATTILVGALLIVAGQLDFVVYFCFLLVVTRVYDPVNLVFQTIAELIDLRLNIQRLRDVQDEPVQTGSAAFAPKGYDLAFEGVSFGYGTGEQVLDNVSFTAREGEVTALVGPSGGGKSTCAKLAARFWDACAGRVLAGGVDVSRVDPETLLADYAEVFQDVVLFDDTVMGNIRLGRADATDEEVLAAARAANCDEFVLRMPQGYDTRIGENGSRLSGGERQRISIARAILKDAPIVLLDEATAALDVENETQVQQALSRLLEGKTVLVIAHRMRTVANADKIVVLKEGRVAEQGAPADLMQREGGLYRRMVRLQSEAAGWVIAS